METVPARVALRKQLHLAREDAVWARVDASEGRQPPEGFTAGVVQTLRLLGAFELPEAGLYRTYADDIAGSRGNWTLDDVDRVLDRYDSALKELDRAHR